MTGALLRAQENTPIDLALLARCEAARLVRGCVSCAREYEYIAGGVMVTDAPGTWCNFAAGVALERIFAPGEVERIEEFFIQRGIEPRIETSPYIHRDALAQLAARGWVVRSYESLLYRPLTKWDLPSAPQVAGLSIRIVDRDDAAGLADFARVACSGFTAPGCTPTKADLELCLRTINHNHSFAMLASVDGVPASAGVVEVAAPAEYNLSALYALSTLPQFRRRGLQQAMIAARLAFAKERNAHVSLIGGRPGADTERNVRRMGFEVAFTITHLVRPGIGLATLP